MRFFQQIKKQKEEMKLLARDNDLQTNMYNCIYITSVDQQSLFIKNW